MTETSLPSYFRYWGKADPNRSGEPKWHLLVYHCLDVAAVGEILLQKNPFLLVSLSKLSGIQEKPLKTMLVFFLAIHDLGKFSENFQALIPELLKELHRKEKSLKQPYSKKVFGHDSIGFLLCKEHIFNQISEQLESISEKSDLRDLLRWFMEACNGHHGLPVKQNVKVLADFFSDSDIHASIEFVRDVIGLLSFRETFPTDLIKAYDRLYEQLSKASWAFTGFNVLCDWIGSGEIFKYYSHEMALATYWNDKALKTAEKALENAGILPCKSNHELDPLSELLELPENSQLTPLQASCLDVPLLDKPQLFIIEDQTGSGKTEGSLILLNRMMAQGLANGFYLALPTMATADGIYPRVQKTYNNLYLSKERPSLVLAHSSAKLSEKFSKTIISPEHSVTEQKYSDDAQSRCQEWITDNRKKALLAHVGVGTIDQAFLAVLKTKYQSLRLVGLIGKIIVIDEAHAYDAYMGKELEVLLEVHAALGGSAIIMSATLTFSTRQKLADAFLSGIGSNKIKLEQKQSYPLLTHIAKDYIQELSFSPKDGEEKKDVHFIFLHLEKDVDNIIRQSLEQDKCVCWIRNSVKDARQTYKRYKEAGLNVRLFHARFTAADRQDIQSQVLKDFGKEGGYEERKGSLLIATQVVEQSLDLDFDVIITDLAPIDLILQRAGRLHRHNRDKWGNLKIIGNDERGMAIFYIHTPEYTDDPQSDWLSSFLPNAKKVYENHARLWLGLKQLWHLPEHKLPKNIRNLIESVYDEESKIPQTLIKSDINADGNDQSGRTMGAFNTIDFKNGYTMDGQEWQEDLKMPTRLGEETLILTLAKWENGQITPFNPVRQRSWQNSEIRVLQKHIAQISQFDDELRVAIENVKQNLPNQGKWINLLPMVWNHKEELWESDVIDCRGQSSKVYYHSKVGLIYAYEFISKQIDEQLETEESI